VQGVVLPDLLDRASTALGAGVCDDDAVVRLTHLSDALQLDLHGHGGVGLLVLEWVSTR
jgi:hypothetical protein